MGKHLNITESKSEIKRNTHLKNLWQLINFALFSHGRCEILAVFIVAIVTQISSLVIMKESFLRLSHPPWVSTWVWFHRIIKFRIDLRTNASFIFRGRLFLGALLCLICHLITTYVNDKGRAFNHVLSSSSSNILQEQLTKFSQRWHNHCVLFIDFFGSLTISKKFRVCLCKPIQK